MCIRDSSRKVDKTICEHDWDIFGHHLCCLRWSLKFKQHVAEVEKYVTAYFEVRNNAEVSLAQKYSKMIKHENFGQNHKE